MGALARAPPRRALSDGRVGILGRFPRLGPRGGLPTLLAAAAVRPHPLVLYVSVALNVAENVVNHSGIDAAWLNLVALKWLPLHAPMAHHDAHHKYSNHGAGAKILGGSTTVWDWAFGTLSSRHCQARWARL